MYFDYLATTPPDPRVLDAMRPYWEGRFGNPHADAHIYGLDAKEAVEEARAKLARLLPGARGEWTFTSGATEANNLVLKGLADLAPAGRTRILVSAIEHPSVLETARFLRGRGFTVDELPVNNDGALDVDAFTSRLGEDVLLASVMWANNETGVIQPVEAAARLCRERGILFHTDATQAAGKIPLETVPDFLSLSAHKLYGPKGIGALYVGPGLRSRLGVQIHGGGQQDGLRSGTVAVPLTVGLGAAVDAALAGMTEEARRLQDIRNRFEEGLRASFPDLRVNGEPSPRLSHVSHFQIPGVPMADLMAALPEIAVARGSACSTGGEEISHVMAAMRMEFFAHECLRVSFGRPTTQADAEALLASVAETAAAIRDQAGFSAQKK